MNLITRLIISFVCITAAPRAAAIDLQVSTNKGNASSPLLYGVLFEDVYHSGDGGIYSEMIQNRAFQGTGVPDRNHISSAPNLDYWKAMGAVTLNLDQQAPLLTSALPNHMRVDVNTGTTGNVGFSNQGFWGFNVTTRTRYGANFYLRGDYHGQIVCSFNRIDTGASLGSATFTVSQSESDGWRPYNQVFTPTQSAADGNNVFQLAFDGSQVAGKSLRFQMISVFQQTYKDSHNGQRMDLAQGVAGLGGKFLRMPGGNNMEGNFSPYRWKWNETIGPIIDRPSFPGTWGYMNTNGFGLLEMMQWCLDMDLTTILGVWGGLYLDGEIVAEADLQPYIDDILNELEFLTGSTSTHYGALRAQYGYTNPFTIEYVEIGNEDFLNGGIPSYIAYRYNKFRDAINAKYPNIKVISSIWIGNFATPPPKGTIQDIHEYISADAMVSKFGGYDHADRNYPVLVGEYAAIYDVNHSGGNQLDNPTLQSATAEGVYFLGLERNADVILGIAHGALIKSLHDEPNNVAMMKHSATDIVYSYSYYIAKLFGNNYGSETVEISSTSAYGPLYWAGTKDSSGKYFIKVVNYNGEASTPVTLNIPGKTGTAKLITLTGPAWDSTNTLGSVTSVWKETSVECNNGVCSFTMPGSYSAAVLVI